MADTTRGLATQPLSLPEEFILMLLNEETGYFHQVHGWELNCAVVGAASRNSPSFRASTRIWNRYTLWTQRKRATPPLILF